MAYPFPSPVSLPALGVSLNLSASLEFDVGRPTVDKAAKFAEVLSITYDQVVMETHDIEATWRENDISTPLAEELVRIFHPLQDPENCYVVAVIITCEMGEASLYICTDLLQDGLFDPPDYRYMIPFPLTSGGVFVHADSHDYERAAIWQTQTDVPIYIGEILAGAFLPTRLTSYVFLRTKEV